ACAGGQGRAVGRVGVGDVRGAVRGRGRAEQGGEERVQELGLGACSRLGADEGGVAVVNAIGAVGAD
ncbi:hypothetical protein FRC08_016128, partial [Ceratobasidium sp. 394]